MIAIIVPVLGRGHLIGPLLENIAKTTSHPYRVVLVCTPDDEATATCQQSGAKTLITEWPAGRGDFARKVNLAYRETDEPWLFQAATDVAFVRGWDTSALRLAEDSGALVVGTYDDGNPAVKRGHQSTHTFIARSYCDDPGASMDGPGTVFSQAYSHQFVDNELAEVAKWRGVWAFCRQSVVRHNHPHWSRGVMDSTYELGLSFFHDDRRVFVQRRRLWTRRNARARVRQ